MEITYDYFLEEVVRFRKVMGSIQFTVEQREKGFEGLCHVYLGGDFAAQTSLAAEIFASVKVDYDARMVYLIMKDLKEKI